MCQFSRYSSIWQSTSFGDQRLQVQILLPRPLLFYVKISNICIDSLKVEHQSPKLIVWVRVLVNVPQISPEHYFNSSALPVQVVSFFLILYCQCSTIKVLEVLILFVNETFRTTLIGSAMGYIFRERGLVYLIAVSIKIDTSNFMLCISTNTTFISSALISIEYISKQLVQCL